MIVITREEALRRGQLTYFTGVPCKRGHIDVRRVENYSCAACLRMTISRWAKDHVAKNSAHRKLRYNTDINRRLSCCLRSRLRNALVRGQKSGSAVIDLGCSLEFFREYIESLFSEGMTWSNWGDKWQIDHRKPLCWFDLSDREQFLEACHWSNLQPLIRSENAAKSRLDLAFRDEMRKAA